MEKKLYVKFTLESEELRMAEREKERQAAEKALHDRAVETAYETIDALLSGNRNYFAEVITEGDFAVLIFAWHNDVELVREACSKIFGSGLDFAVFPKCDIHESNVVIKVYSPVKKRKDAQEYEFKESYF